MKGKIVLVPFPFTDFTATKLRPALVIYEGNRDIIVAFISSKIPSELFEVDVLLMKNQSGFRNTGLKLDSVIKLESKTKKDTGDMKYELIKCFRKT